jgi:Histidine kinase-, DNA gyrase B-, and HSP90-like ATPase
MSTTQQNLSDDLVAQRAYSQRQAEQGFDFGLTVADAFVRGIRDIGYKDTGTALDEQLDNSVQAEATKILVTFGFDGKSSAKPTAIAVADNGHGMDPEMVRLAAIWGGTHRENDRHGFGRYGYGLPSSCVSQGKRFTIYSLVEGGTLHSVTLDLDDISAGKLNGENGRIVVPEAKPATLPDWLAAEIVERFGSGNFAHGTVVLIEKLDRLTWSTKAALERHLLQGIGITYRNFLRNVTIWVADKRVEPLDPLFTTPGYRFFDLDADRADALDEHAFDVKDSETRESLGTVRVRYSSMPPTFARVDKKVERGKNNARFPIMADYNGIIVMREGRQIDVVPRGGWLAVNNDDRYWGCEVDIPATLDEEMAITTTKQRVILSERMWTLLKEQGVQGNIAALRRRYDEEKAKARTQREAESKAQKASEQAMAAADKFKTENTPDTPERRRKSKEAFDREAERRAKESGVAREQVEAQLEAETKENPYRVQTESHRGAPFFRIEQVGPQQVLYLNTAHRFYKDVYAGAEATPRLRSALEVVLFSIGTAEIDAEGERLMFYETERALWSTRLNVALAQLENIDAPQEERPAEDDVGVAESVEA